MKKKVSLIRLIRFWGIIIVLTIAAVISIADIITSYNRLDANIKKTRANYLKEQKALIRHEVERVINSIQYERKQCKILAKEAVKQRVYEAWTIATNIYNVNKNSKSPQAIKRMIVDALSPIKFPGNGYYFIVTLNGENVLLNNLPDLTGKKIIDIQDFDGRYVIKDIIAIAKTLPSEGFYNYTWMKPNQQIGLPKSSYIKKFAPYNWAIGAGLYIDNVETMVKEKVMKRINDIRFGKNGYMFVDDWNGINLANGAKPALIGTNMWEVEDSKGKKTTQSLIAASKQPHGGYVYYWWIKPDTGQERPKLAFAKGVPEWQILVGTGIYLDDIDDDIAIMHDDLNNQTKHKVIIFIIVAALVVAITVYLIDLLSRKLNNDFKIYAAAFAKAASANKKIDHFNIRFAELDQMARYANKILQDKINAQHNLLTQKEHLDVTLRSINEGVITVDNSCRIFTMNDAAGKLTGWQEKAAIGKVISDVFNITNNDHQQNITDIINGILDTGKMEEHTNHYILVSKNGVEYHIADSITPLKDAENNMLGAVIVFRDITARLRREDEQLKVNKLESIGVLAGGIAHNFNNILTGIFGNLEFAKAQLPPTHQAYNFISTACQALERATGLTKQLLTFAKGGDPIIKPLNVEEIIRDAVDFNLGGSNIKAKLNLPDTLWKINADKGQINQVLSNLILNAKHAMPAGGSIEIEAENITDPIVANLTGNFVMLKIHDNGVGIPKKYIKQIFDPYFTTKHDGNGLGLATTHSIIRRHHGHIMVETNKKNGTCFTIYLPAGKITEQLEPIVSATKNPPKKATGRILIMDDEAMIQEVSETILTSCGYQVDLAADGKAALEKYRTAMVKLNPFDLVIMDLTIPGGMGGKDAIKKLLELDPAAKVIASSGYSTDPIIANYLKYGFKGRLTKPFRLEALQAEVARILNEA